MDRTDLLERSKELWILSFPNEGGYTDYYFSHICTSDVILAHHEEGGQTVSAAQFIPYGMNLLGQRTSMYYISGVCTHPQWRGRGMARKCLIHYFDELRNKSPFAMLIPASTSLFEYYYRYLGFTVSSCRDWKNVCVDNMDVGLGDVDFSWCSYDNMICEEREELFGKILRYWDSKPNCVLRSIPALRNAVEAYYDLHIAFCRKGKREVFAICSILCDRVIMHEAVSDDEELFSCMIGHIMRICDMRKILMPIYEKKPLSMVRILNVEEALRIYARDLITEECLKITDILLPENNGIFLLKDGECHKLDRNPDNICVVALFIEDLQKRMFNKQSLYMPLMLDY